MAGGLRDSSPDSPLKASPDMIALELVVSEVNGRVNNNEVPMLSLIASAILIDLLRSSSLVEASLESLASSSGSSVNPAAYISIASSTVIPPAFETGLDCGSLVDSVTEVPFVKILLRSVLVVSTGLELVVNADRKLDLTS